MPKPIHVPKYRRASNGQAFVEHRSINTKTRRLYLGSYGTEDSLKRYQQFLARLSHSTVSLPPDRRGTTRIDVMIHANFASNCKKKIKK